MLLYVSVHYVLYPCTGIRSTAQAYNSMVRYVYAQCTVHLYVHTSIQCWNNNSYYALLPVAKARISSCLSVYHMTIFPAAAKLREHNSLQSPLLV